MRVAVISIASVAVLPDTNLTQDCKLRASYCSLLVQPEPGSVRQSIINVQRRPVVTGGHEMAPEESLPHIK